MISCSNRSDGQILLQQHIGPVNEDDYFFSFDWWGRLTDSNRHAP